MLCHAAASTASAVASGRNWSVSISRLECQGASVVVGLQVRYLGPSGAVEAPVSQLTDQSAKPYPPKSVAWKPGAKPLAEWLSAGGLRNLKPEPLGEVDLKFDLSGATGALSFEFGDIRALSVTRRPLAGGCDDFLRPEQIQAPRAARPAKVDSSKLDFRVHRGGYPCSPSRTITADYPPYPPMQLLLFGRGYLPGARTIELPMGRAPAQGYAYAGPDDLGTVEKAAQHALLADFPQYASRSKYFAFNWGVQKSQSGNDAYSIGIYEIRRCPRA
jgi:hypothetical protein